MDCDLEEALQDLQQNHCYITVAIGDSNLKAHVTAERFLLGSTNNGISTLVALIATYYTCNIAYPKQLFPVCVFLQHFVLQIVDKQKVPDIVKRILASLDRITT